jgi:hypothetical protein
LGIKESDAGFEAIKKVATNFTPKSLRDENVGIFYQKKENNIILTLLRWLVEFLQLSYWTQNQHQI